MRYPKCEVPFLAAFFRRFFVYFIIFRKKIHKFVKNFKNFGPKCVVVLKKSKIFGSKMKDLSPKCEVGPPSDAKLGGVKLKKINFDQK